jgi:nucleotide-binding universal stress UspA family protein
MDTGPLLVCYDGSEGAKAALAAAALAFTGREAIIACYWQPFGSSKRYGIDLRELVQDPTEINRREAALAHTLAHEGATLARHAGLDAHPHAIQIDGPIDEAILTHADTLDATAIILGSRSRSTLRSLLIGSIANEIVQRSPRPVYLTPPPNLAHRRRDQLTHQTTNN